MKGRLKVERPAYGPDVTLPERITHEGEQYQVTDRRKVKPRRWWMFWRRTAEIDAVREDRQHERD